MSVLVCIAGLSQEMLEEIDKNYGRFSGEKGSKPLAFPLKGDLCYRHGMSDIYLTSLVERISSLPERDDVCIALAFANHPGKGTERFLRTFFPFALTMPFEPFHVYDYSKHQQRQARLHFLNDLAERLDALQRCIREMKAQLSGQNFSPLTLPVRNFRSNVLRSELIGLFENLWKSSNPSEAIIAAAKKIAMSHPKNRIKSDEQNHLSDNNKPYFIDDRKLRFKSPGADRHGYIRDVSKGHNDACFIASRVRIGGPIISRMHYDCDYFPRRDVTDIFTNCHDEAATAKKTSHANIAPSDAVW